MIGGGMVDGHGGERRGVDSREVTEPQSVRDGLPPTSHELAQDLRMAIVWASAALAALEDEREDLVRMCVDRLADYAGRVRSRT